jgi:voltage-gated potassium channel
MTDGGLTPGQRPSLTERRIERIVNARSVTIGLAATFIGLALVGAIVMRIADPDNFPSVGLAIWWALQTVTTVGYGDVVPTTDAGRVVGGVEMVIGIAFIAFVTAGVTSTVIQRGEAEAKEAGLAQTQTIIDAMTQTTQALTELGERLDQIESKITK